jgi:MFS family permease
MLIRLNRIYNKFPRMFWVVVGVSFIDRIGATLLFPFFALYITQKFDVGMTEAGMVIGMFSISGMFGGMIGGALTDRFGRRRLILFGLVFSAVSTLTLGLADRFAALFPLAVVIGILGELSSPAHQAMIADILPEDKRQDGFGILRVTANMSWIIGPTIGGFVANRSFFGLFVLDALVSCIVAVLFYLLIPETKPAAHDGPKAESLLQTFGGYRRALRDFPFIAFILASILMGIVYQQMYNALSVYLLDQHGIAPQGYGFLLTCSATVVIFFQLWTIRVIKVRPPFLMMALGVVFYAVGFSLFGFVSAYSLFLCAILIITVGEMIVVPISSALSAKFAPAEMRGRYMAFFGLTWILPSMFGPVAAGYLLDHFDGNLLWYIDGIVCGVAALCFYALHLRLGAQERFAPAVGKNPLPAPGD